MGAAGSPSPPPRSRTGGPSGGAGGLNLALVPRETVLINNQYYKILLDLKNSMSEKRK